MSTKKIQEDISEAGEQSQDETSTDINADSQPVTMDEVVARVEHTICDSHELCKHIAAGTTAEYLTTAVDAIVLDLTIVPIARLMNGDELEDDVGTVTDGFHRIASMLSAYFNQDQQSIETILTARMNSFPIDDVRQSYVLRKQGQLH